MTDREAMKMALEALEAHADFGLKSEKAVEALRQALAQPANQSDCGHEEYKPFCQMCMATKQKPVAVIGNWGSVEWAEGVFPQIGDKMYAAPPKQWVGLTDVEIVDIMDAELSAQSTEHFALCQAIEAKLKEKNT